MVIVITCNPSVTVNDAVRFIRETKGKHTWIKDIEARSFFKPKPGETVIPREGFSNVISS